MPDKVKRFITTDHRLAATQEAGLDERQRAFLRMVSHELRTPLNTILGFGDIISKELYGPLGSPRYREYADLIVASGQRLLSLANQVIEIAKLEGQVAELEVTIQSLDHALDDVLDQLADVVIRAGVLLVVENQGHLPMLHADAQGLRTVLANLVHNVCNHCPHGTRLVISAVRIGDEIVISLTDDGPGIEPCDVVRVVRPFEQGGSPLSRQNQGAGLGLSIVTLLCQGMEGRLELNSRIGGGLTACVHLPAT